MKICRFLYTTPLQNNLYALCFTLTFPLSPTTPHRAPPTCGLTLSTETCALSYIRLRLPDNSGPVRQLQ